MHAPSRRTDPDRALVPTTLAARESERVALLNASDTEGLETIAHPDLAYAHSSGTVDALHDLLGKIGRGVYVYRDLEFFVESVVLGAHSAALVGRTTGTVTARGVERALDNTTTNLWESTDAGWRWLASSNVARA
jgi:hypothetical protein